MITYDRETTPLLSAIHRISGTVRTGKSNRVRNLKTVLQMERNVDALDLELSQAIDTIRGLAGALEINVPERYDFTVAGRELTCIHGIVSKKRMYTTEHEYRFVIVFRDEVFAAMKSEFKMTERRWSKLLEERLAV